MTLRTLIGGDQAFRQHRKAISYSKVFPSKTQNNKKKSKLLKYEQQFVIILKFKKFT